MYVFNICQNDITIAKGSFEVFVNKKLETGNVLRSCPGLTCEPEDGAFSNYMKYSYFLYN